MTIALSAMGMQVSQSAMIYMEVLDFDGENYTIYYRIEPETGISEDFTVRVNKQGSIVGELPPEIQQFWVLEGGSMSLPGFGGNFPKTEAAVGEEIQSPLSLDISGMHITGNVKIRFGGITTKTFAGIGEFKVFKVDFSVSDLRATYQNVVVTGSIDGYGYYEYNTCLPVEYFARDSFSVSQDGQTYTVNIDLQINLIELNRS